MDVALLGRSLTAFGELCEDANKVVNGEAGKVTVLLRADVQAGCVTLDLALVQAVWATASGLVLHPDPVSAQQILTWIGFIKGPTVDLIKFLIWKKNRKETGTTVNGDGNVVIQVTGDNNTITVPQYVHKLSKEPRVVKDVKEVLSPVAESNGIQEADFIYQNRRLRINASTAAAIKEIEIDEGAQSPQVFTAHIVVHAPTLSENAKVWKFKLNNRVEPIDIGETDIATDALERGGVSVGDTYKVKLEMVERRKANGEFVMDYKVKEVLEFLPGRRSLQSQLPMTTSEDQGSGPTIT